VVDSTDFLVAGVALVVEVADSVALAAEVLVVGDLVVAGS
jgi:hypothetical protein